MPASKTTKTAPTLIRVAMAAPDSPMLTDAPKLPSPTARAASISVSIG